jgi:hypothetical protein
MTDPLGSSRSVLPVALSTGTSVSHGHLQPLSLYPQFAQRHVPHPASRAAGLPAPLPMPCHPPPPLLRPPLLCRRDTQLEACAHRLRPPRRHELCVSRISSITGTYFFLELVHLVYEFAGFIISYKKRHCLRIYYSAPNCIHTSGFRKEEAKDTNCTDSQSTRMCKGQYTRGTRS